MTTPNTTPKPCTDSRDIFCREAAPERDAVRRARARLNRFFERERRRLSD
jgi:hypothetical protein